MTKFSRMNRPVGTLPLGVVSSNGGGWGVTRPLASWVMANFRPRQAMSPSAAPHGLGTSELWLQ